MTAGEEPQDQAENGEKGQEKTPGEPGGMSERTAKAIIIVVAVGAVWGIVAAFPWIAYIVTGSLLTVGWQKAASWIGGRRENDEEEPAPEPLSALDIVDALHAVADPHVFLADVAAELAVSKEDARALLENLGIRVRRAVRNGESTGVGVHKDDLPPLPDLSPEDHETAVDQGQPTNQQAVTVEHIGQPGRIVKDGTTAARRYRA